ncbi:MAG: site-specific integrase [Nitrososphaeraceae archaeon]
MSASHTRRKKSTNTPQELLLDKEGITQLTLGLSDRFPNAFNDLSEDNASAIANYIQSMKIEINLSDHYGKDLVLLLSTFSKYTNNKLFEDLTREDILAFLNSIVKSVESDPLHKWIGTYNVYRGHLQKFFKWLYYLNFEPSKRPKPDVVKNLPKLKRKEQSIYKPSDLWTAEDDLLFLKYCHSKRMKCFHVMSRDTSCRPHELLKLRIRDIVFKNAPAGNRQYAEVLVNGKTGSRHIPLIDSLPYIKDYINHEHPHPSNQNAILLCGVGKSLGRSINVISLHGIYNRYKTKLFPKLLQDPNVPEEDKQKIEELLKKPWNPYIRRHSALTEKSSFLKEHILRQHAGWSPRSQMHLKYLHYFGNESSESILQEYGILPKDNQEANLLRPKQCPNCNEPNRPDQKFCVKCMMVLTYDAYSETLEEQRRESEVQNLKEKYEEDMKAMREEMENKFQQILAKIDVATLK